MIKPTTKFAVIIVQYDPESGTDYLITKAEEVTNTLPEAKKLQTELLRDPILKQADTHYRSYIQEREYQQMIAPKGKTKTTYRITRVSNLVER